MFGTIVRRLKKQRYLQCMAIIGVIWIIIFNYLPMYGIIIAFKDYKIYKAISEADWVGLKWFAEVFADSNFWSAMRNTLAMSFLKLFIGFPLPIIFTVLLNEIRQLKFKKIVQTVTYLPHFLSWVIFGGILISWLSYTGLFNEILRIINPAHEAINYMAKPQYFWGIAVISEALKELGWSAIIYLAAISGINPTMYEAAKVDGVNRWQKIRHITIPAIQGTVAVMFILAVGNLLNTNFEQILVLKNQLNAPTAEVLDSFVFKMGIQSGRFSYATTLGLFKSVVALILLITANRVTSKLTKNQFY